MKTTLKFEVDSDKVDVDGRSDYLNELADLKDIMNVGNYKLALWDIQQLLREIVKYKLDGTNGDKLINDFYYETFPEILRTRKINLDED